MSKVPECDYLRFWDTLRFISAVAAYDAVKDVVGRRAQFFSWLVQVCCVPGLSIGLGYRILLF